AAAGGEARHARAACSVLAPAASADRRLVCGWRRRRADAWSKRVGSRIANAVRSRVLGDATPDTGCGLKLIHRATFLELPFFDHQHRFLPALVAARGGRIVSVEGNHPPRRHGRSKYGLLHRRGPGILALVGVLWRRRRARAGAAAELRRGRTASAARVGTASAPDRLPSRRGNGPARGRCW